MENDVDYIEMELSEIELDFVLTALKQTDTNDEKTSVVRSELIRECESLKILL